MTSTTGVLHLVDTLDMGGAENIAVMLANHLPQKGYRTYLCATRKSGALQNRILPSVIFYDLHRKGRFDVFALSRLASFIRRENIQIIHAHTTSLFIGIFLSILNPKLRLIWHDHVGLQELRTRPVHLYRPFVRRVEAILTVTRQLAEWSVTTFGVIPNRVSYLPNFIEPQERPAGYLCLPGESGKRIVCVANLRSQKDHITLVHAFEKVIQIEPEAHLLLVGAQTDNHLAEQVFQDIHRFSLEPNITWMGPREDIPLILENCDIGVLSSASEGFPVVLLEYGRAGLAVVATNVGECSEILDGGKAGFLVPPGNPDALAASLIDLLGKPALRSELGTRLCHRVNQEYSMEKVLNRVCEIYEHIL